MTELVNRYCSNIQNTIENNKTFKYFNNMSSMELNWYGPIFSGLSDDIEECCEIFYKKLYYSLDKNVLNYRFKIEIIISSYTTKIKYIYFKDNRFCYDKIFNNNY